ncbi:MAG TPA: glycosyltransferase family 39 protein, partial [Aggregatilineales bacterium]|nr:glycosyltransferase family 39 protein [Aggregatilineales bacterium]
MNCGASALSTERGRVRSTAPGRYIAGNTFLFALVLLAAFVLRLWNLGTQSLWHDEAWSVFSAYHPLAWGQLGTDPNAPPIFYVTLSLWQHLAGDGVWAMRFWSLLIGVITVAITAHMTRRWYGERTALLAATFVAFCPILWVFSQEIRAYVAMPLLAIVLLALLDALVKPRPVIPRQWWAWVAVVELVALYTHNLSVPIVAWLNIAALAVWALRREWRRLAWWGVLQAGIAVAYLPWLLTQRPTGTLLNTPPALRPQLIWDIWQSYFTGIKTLVGADTALMTLTALMGIGGLVVIMSLISRLLVAGSDPPSISTSDREWTRNRRMTTVLILSQAVLIPLLSLIEILGAHIDFHPRYFIDSAPATLMVIAIGLTGIPMRRIRPALAFAAVGLAIALMLRMMTVTYSSPLYQHDDFRTIAEHYARLGPDDRVIIPYGWEPTLDYYGQKMGFKDKLIGIPLYSSGDQIRAGVVAALQQARNVELLTWYQLPADVRGAYACLLGSAGHLDGSLIVEGLKTDHYDSLSALSPVEYDHRPSDRLRMDALEYEPTAANPWGRDGLCVLTRWKLWQQSSENLRLSAILRNNQGWEIAKVDSDILNDR